MTSKRKPPAPRLNFTAIPGAASATITSSSATTAFPQTSSSSLSSSSISTSSTTLSAQTGLAQPHSPSTTLHNELNNLDIGNGSGKLDIKDKDLEKLEELGAGNGGTVWRVRYLPTGAIMARKIIPFQSEGKDENDKSSVRKRILRELQILDQCNCPSIVSFFGAYLEGGEVSICMEFMDCGSLDSIYRKTGPIQESVIGKITVAVIEGLVYLHDTFRIIHRDIKPSNVLLNSKGDIKIADFGVSGHLVNSMANTFVGTSAYMSPERIQGGKYSVRSDVWSLGITVMEMALGRFPFNLPVTCAPFELLQCIVNEPVPTLPADQFSSDFDDLIVKSLIKDPADRPSPRALLKHAFVIRSKGTVVNMEEWVKKHHLAG